MTFFQLSGETCDLTFLQSIMSKHTQHNNKKMNNFSFLLVLAFCFNFAFGVSIVGKRNDVRCSCESVASTSVTDSSPPAGGKRVVNDSNSTDTPKEFDITITKSSANDDDDNLKEPDESLLKRKNQTIQPGQADEPKEPLPAKYVDLIPTSLDERQYTAVLNLSGMLFNVSLDTTFYSLLLPASNCDSAGCDVTRSKADTKRINFHNPGATLPKLNQDIDLTKQGFVSASLGNTPAIDMPLFLVHNTSLVNKLGFGLALPAPQYSNCSLASPCEGKSAKVCDPIKLECGSMIHLLQKTNSSSFYFQFPYVGGLKHGRFSLSKPNWLKSNFTYVALNPNTTKWTFDVKSFSVDTINLIDKSKVVSFVVSSANPNIALDDTLFKKVSDAFQKKGIDINQSIDCDTKNAPTLSFKGNNVSYSIPAKVYMARNAENQCVILIRKSYSSFNYLGIPFLRQYTSHFDFGGHRLGFAVTDQSSFK